MSLLLGLYIGSIMTMSLFVYLSVIIPGNISFVTVVVRILAVLFSIFNFFMLGVLIHHWIKMTKEEKSPIRPNNMKFNSFDEEA